ncbi:atp-nad kinase [Ceraceosorus bombacis]|uniref:Atp-nad kinase n=1 Tax=Ceraceosorus bombacis TaxID=401625 RepID=A0A0P1BP51_9BASI|nr:atp-nad kinase [Ceraceosorus bombacis]
MRNIAEGGWDRIESPVPQGSDLRGHMTENGRDPGNNDTRPAGPPPPAAAIPQQRKDKEVMCFTTRPVETFEVLNDLVVDRGPSPYVSLLEVFGNEHHMTTAQADGLCISTPTGSTAYSLSAGGSLVHPEIPSILITPICPHTLSFRPMLLPDSMELRIAVPYNSRSTAWASFDGRGRVELKQGDHIKVTASRYPFPTVCAENQSIDWFNSISRTLKWNERQRQKSFVVVEEGAEKSSSSEPKEGQRSAKSQSSMQGAGHETDDNEDDAEAEAETEAFDIDDTDTAAPTRTASPDPDPPRSAASLNQFVRRNSVRSRTSSGHHHHHHPNGRTIRSAPTSNRASSEHLNRSGMAPLTRGDKQTTSESSPSDTSSSPSAPHQAGLEKFERDQKLLSSPDRFGLAGPPMPPRSISERHLASADFRLDDPSPRPSEAPLSLSSQDSTGLPRQAAELQAQTRRLSGEAQAQTRGQSSEGANTASHAGTETTSSIAARRSSSQRKQSRRQKKVASVDPNGRRSSGAGAALIVYGQDESDSGDLTE